MCMLRAFPGLMSGLGAARRIGSGEDTSLGGEHDPLSESEVDDSDEEETIISDCIAGGGPMSVSLFIVQHIIN